MKLIANTSRIFEMGVSSEIPTGNLVWVDRVNGNDLIALRGRMDRPFLTLTAAKNAAVSGDTILVAPGVYTDADLAKDGVNWHFLTGASVVNSSGGSVAIFDIAATMSFKVTGQGEFSSTSNRRTIRISGGSPTVSFQCAKLSAESFVVEIYSSGNVTIKATQIQATSTGSAIYLSSAAAVVQIDADSVTSVQATAVDFSGGNLVINAGTIKSDQNRAVYISGGTGVVTAREIIADVDSSAVQFDGGVLTLNRCRIVCNTLGGANRAVYVSGGPTSGSAALRLVQCVLICFGASSNAIVGLTSPRPVGYYGQCIANKSQGSNITAQVSTLLSDANVL